ncbi:hypothetical protein BSNK01_00870 [Bacillaceae bacterium]
MIALAKVTFAPEEKVVPVKAGSTILEAAMKGRVALAHKCGGRASCTTCKVIVDPRAAVSLANGKEKSKLGSDRVAQGYRLACQARVYGDVVVTIPEDPLKAAIRARLAKKTEER